jgi:hypothetical protein
MFLQATVRHRRKPRQSAMLHLRDIGETLLLLLIHPAYWPRAARLLCRALGLLGRWCRIQCRISWYCWRLGVPRAEAWRQLDPQSLHRG